MRLREAPGNFESEDVLEMANAGPARIRSLRTEAQSLGLDPNVWFDNVERVAAYRIGRETVQYVANIYKYYIAYTLVQDKVQEGLKKQR